MARTSPTGSRLGLRAAGQPRFRATNRVSSGLAPGGNPSGGVGSRAAPYAVPTLACHRHTARASAPDRARRKRTSAASNAQPPARGRPAAARPAAPPSRAGGQRPASTLVPPRQVLRRQVDGLVRHLRVRRGPDLHGQHEQPARRQASGHRRRHAERVGRVFQRLEGAVEVVGARAARRVRLHRFREHGRPSAGLPVRFQPLAPRAVRQQGGEGAGAAAHVQHAIARPRQRGSPPAFRPIAPGPRGPTDGRRGSNRRRAHRPPRAGEHQPAGGTVQADRPPVPPRRLRLRLRAVAPKAVEELGGNALHALHALRGGLAGDRARRQAFGVARDAGSGPVQLR